MRWVRQGECPPEKCGGRCCERVGFWLSDGGMTAEWLTARGFNVIDVNGHVLADIPQRCQHLTDSGLCALHPDMKPVGGLPMRPVLCDIWPTEPSQIANHPYCGFSFIEEPEGVLT